jgi:hypothetical protein
MVTGAAVATPHDGAVATVEDQQAAGVGILLQILMLVLSFVLGHLLRRRKFYYLPEASASLLIGAYVSIPPPAALDPRRSGNWFVEIPKCRSLEVRTRDFTSSPWGYSPIRRDRDGPCQRFV